MSWKASAVQIQLFAAPSIRSRQAAATLEGGAGTASPVPISERTTESTSATSTQLFLGLRIGSTVPTQALHRRVFFPDLAARRVPRLVMDILATCFYVIVDSED